MFSDRKFSAPTTSGPGHLHPCCESAQHRSSAEPKRSMATPVRPTSSAPRSEGRLKAASRRIHAAHAKHSAIHATNVNSPRAEHRESSECPAHADSQDVLFGPPGTRLAAGGCLLSVLSQAKPQTLKAELRFCGCSAPEMLNLPACISLQSGNKFMFGREGGESDLDNPSVFVHLDSLTQPSMLSR